MAEPTSRTPLVDVASTNRIAGPTAGRDASPRKMGGRLTQSVARVGSLYIAALGSISELTNVTFSSHWLTPLPRLTPLFFLNPQFRGFSHRGSRKISGFSLFPLAPARSPATARGRTPLPGAKGTAFPHLPVSHLPPPNPLPFRVSSTDQDSSRESSCSKRLIFDLPTWSASKLS